MSIWFNISSKVVNNNIQIGSVESSVICRNKSCQHASDNIEPFITLSLALKAKTLEDCLKEFFKDEEVRDYKCEKCKQNLILKRTRLH